MATLGYTSIGATTGTTTVTTGAQTPVCCKFTATEYGILNSISFYANALSGTTNIKTAIYYGGGTVGTPYMLLGAQDLAPTVITTTPGWSTNSFSALQLSAGTTYWLVFIGDTSFNYYFDAGSTSQQYTGAVFTYPTFLSPETGAATANNQISVYATYTPRALSPYSYNQIDRISSIQRVKSIRI